LEKMVSAGRIEQLGIEIAMLKRENELCKDRIEGMLQCLLVTLEITNG